jgi:DNA polymerase III subunit epsilon
MTGFAVIDVETTGLLPSDRIVEIGILLLNPDGIVEEEFSSLVKPGRDVGATAIHGLNASDLTDAPAFADLAPYIATLIRGRLPVAHNARFDLTFMAQEFRRAGLKFPDTTPAACTMSMSGSMLGNIRSLEQACDFLSIDNFQQHSALGDAQATTELFQRLACEMASPSWLPGLGIFVWDGNVGRLKTKSDNMNALLGEVSGYWPEYGHAAYPNTCIRSEAKRHRAEADGRLASLIRRLPPVVGQPDQSPEYFSLLDSILLDRYVSKDEVDTLSKAVADWGLSIDNALTTHRGYLQRLAHAALRDAIVTKAELDDLKRVCLLLALDPSEVDQALAAAAGIEQEASEFGLKLEPGDRVTFTGEMSVPRSALEAIAKAAGLVVGSITTKNRALVLADPNSQSGKAAKARKFGVTVVSEQVFRYAVEEITHRRR